MGSSYAAIRNLVWLYGTANVPNIELSGQGMFQAMCAQAPGREKLSELLALGGEEVLGDSGGVSPEAYVLVNLPWSRVNGIMDAKRPTDTTLVDSDINININFNDASKWMTGSGFRTYASAFEKADVYLRQGDFTGGSRISLDRIMEASPEKIYNYPFIWHVSNKIKQFNASSAARVTLDLTGFLNADLVGMTMYVLKDGEIDNNNGANSISPFNSVAVRDVRVLFNGETVYYAPGTSYRFWNMNDFPGAKGYNNSVITTGGAFPYASTPVENHPIRLSFSRVDCDRYCDILYNVWRIKGGNPLQVSFLVPDPTPQNYTMIITDSYNALLAVQDQKSFLQTS